MTLTSEDKLLLLSMKLNLNDEESLQFSSLLQSSLEWEKITTAAVKNGLGALLYKKVNTDQNKALVPYTSLAELKKIYYKNYGRNVIFYDHFKEASELFRKENIEIIPLKGIYLAEKVYVDLGLRQLSDIDLLCKSSEDAERCRQLLLQMGYIDNNVFPSNFIKEHEKHLAPLVKDGVVIELHTYFHRKNNIYEVLMSDVWANAGKDVINGTDVPVLSPSDMLLHLIIHLNSHFDIRLFQLKLFADILNFIDLFHDEINWAELEKRCNSYKCLDIVKENLFVLKQYCDYCCPWVLDPMCLSDENKTRVFIHMLKYDHELMTDDRIKFNISRNIINIKKEKGFWNKLKHLWSDLFPSPSFMIQNYSIKYKWTVFGYYIIRFFIGLYKLFMYLIIRRKKNSSAY